ncbi:type II secretion system F family protein [Sulfoacidibacillus thermotolerans]|uniref:Type II secretion system protein GspF domain-containing protein n=1 Tax=Sulfoacidibacillus thermotolerans TaxID=1765684 RepID=A0A2U3DCW4_SULT2|nr:type II secretion system F family protein [Sulfoacidibacillus thermotolerans]PWI59085.1 hypothetical protein BM613_00310 [Sulfoacidibacillus thermotolerans]
MLQAEKYLIVLLIVSCFVVLAKWQRDRKDYERQKIIHDRMRLYHIQRQDSFDELSISFWERVMMPFWHKLFESLFHLLTPQNMRHKWIQQLQQAGSSLRIEQFVIMRFAFSLVMMAVGVYLAMWIPALSPSERVLLPIFFAGSMYLFIGARLKTAAQKRLKQLERSLPEVFDLLSVSVVAGLGFDSALYKMVKNMPESPAKDEFGRVLSDMRLGMSRTDALRALAERTHLPELHRFASLVTQSDRMGGGIAVALKAQAQDIKNTRSMRAREKAALIPVKIIFPMIVFIFPAIFVVILGPAILSFIQVFHG